MTSTEAPGDMLVELLSEAESTPVTGAPRCVPRGPPRLSPRPPASPRDDEAGDDLVALMSVSELAAAVMACSSAGPTSGAEMQPHQASFLIDDRSPHRPLVVGLVTNLRATPLSNVDKTGLCRSMLRSHLRTSAATVVRPVDRSSTL